MKRFGEFFWSWWGLAAFMAVMLVLIVGGALGLDAITTSPNELNRARIAELEDRIAELEGK